MRRSILALRTAVGLAAATLLVAATVAQADGGPRTIVVRPAPRHYWQRYHFGPAPGRFGSPVYTLGAPRFAPAPPPYFASPYAYPVGFGYGAPLYYANPYVNSVAAYWPTLDINANPVLQGTLVENQLRWGMPLPPAMPSMRTQMRVRPSSPEQKAKSIHAQAQGDVWMHKLKFLNAYERYKYAISAAGDRPEPYFRLGFALTSMASFDSAVKSFKQGLELDPQWPVHGDRLETIYGDDNRLTVLTVLERVGGWVREDIRDPDRLFLMGVMLHFDGDTRASEFFEAAYRLAGYGDHLLAFLQPPDGNNAQAAGPQPPGFSSGIAPPPAPMEPQVPLGPHSPPIQNPFGQNGNSPALSPRPPVAPPDANAPRRSLFQRSPNAPPRRGIPNIPAPPTQPAPGNSMPQAPQNATPSDRPPTQPALPVPPLPVPEDSAPESDATPPSNPSDGPALIAPTSGGRSTQESR